MQSWRLQRSWITFSVILIDNFNPCSHEDCNTSNRPKTFAFFSFQSMQSWRLQLPRPAVCPNFAQFQSMQSWRLQPNSEYLRLKGIEISIHAVMKTATRHIRTRVRRTQISIHAVMKTATISDFDINNYYTISIHAVMKTATLQQLMLENRLLNFNPCSHEDCNCKHI